MTDQYPINPPPELIEDWIELSRPKKDRTPNPNVLATYAARWGADTELEACCKWLDTQIGAISPNDLRAARRPKPSSFGLEARIENLEALVHELRVRYLQIANSVANQLPNRAKFFADLSPDSGD